MNKRYNNTEYIHNYLQNKKPLQTVIDMTCGNGYDTYFLSTICKHVMAIDIQAIAIHRTKERCKHCDNITYINQNHSQLDINSLSNIDGIIYNLGYLPNSDKNIITTPTSTLTSLKNLYPIVNKFIIITCYRGHQGGVEEFNTINDYIESLDDTIIHYFNPTNTLSPYTFIIEKHTKVTR